MAVASVGFGPALRAWSRAGLTHLLCECPAEALKAALLPAGRAALPAAAAHTPGGAHSGSAQRPDGSANSAGARSGFVPAAFSGTLSFASRQGFPADPAAWPPPWDTFFAKAAAAPIVWTYHELGADLSGCGHSPDRGAFFRQLIGELRLPRGSSVFWPCAAPVSAEEGENALRANPAAFAAGLDRLSPRLVVVFGERAMADMGLANRCGYFQQSMAEGKLLVLLPDIEEMARGAAQRSSAASLLRAVISSLNL